MSQNYQQKQNKSIIAIIGFIKSPVFVDKS